jgi:transposase-like protein
MSSHHGQILEKVIRRGQYSISDIARMVNVDRRSIYNWISQPILKHEIIYKIGRKILHDFSVEFPDLFTPADFKFEYKPSFSVEYNRQKPREEASDESSQWRKKYLDLYSKFEKVLNACD